MFMLGYCNDESASFEILKDELNIKAWSAIVDKHSAIVNNVLKIDIIPRNLPESLRDEVKTNLTTFINYVKRDLIIMASKSYGVNLSFSLRRC